MQHFSYLWQCCGVFADTLHCPECGCSLFDNPLSSEEEETESEPPSKNRNEQITLKPQLIWQSHVERKSMITLKEQIQNINTLMEKRGKDLNKPMAAAHVAMLGATLQDDSVKVTDEDILLLSPDLRKMALGGLALVLIQALQE